MTMVFDFQGPSEFVRPGEDFEIVGYFELLRHLGVNNPNDPFDARPSAEQLNAIVAWLQTHSPNELLREALMEHGVELTPSARATA